jgi:hypothetical protein
VVVGAPLALALVVVLWAAIRPIPIRLKRGLGVALGLYVLGALGFEAASENWLRQDREVGSTLFESIEEFLEVGACVLAIHLILRTLPLCLIGGGADASARELGDGARMTA